VDTYLSEEATIIHMLFSGASHLKAFQELLKFCSGFVLVPIPLIFNFSWQCVKEGITVPHILTDTLIFRTLSSFRVGHEKSRACLLLQAFHVLPTPSCHLYCRLCSTCTLLLFLLSRFWLMC